MTNNAKNDHSISMDELTGGAVLPQSPQPIKVTPDLNTPADTSEPNHTVTPPVAADQPNIIPASQPPVSLHDQLVANRTYRVAPVSESQGMQHADSQPTTHFHDAPSPNEHATFAAPANHQPLTLGDSAATPKIAPKINLIPELDTEGGLRDAEGVLPTTWFGRLLKLMHFKHLFTRQRLRYLGIGLFSFGVFYLIFNFQLIVAQVGYMVNKPKQVSTLTVPQSTPLASTAAATQAEIVPPDNVIVIPKINVNAPVVLEPSLAEKNIQKSLQNGVVHYAGTALPGEPGNVAIVGHSSNDWWEPGNYKFVFALLDKLVVGDKIQVNYNSRKYVYQVREIKVVEPTDLSVLAPTSEPSLTLITCTPPGTSWKRLIIRAAQIEPAVGQPTQLVQASPTPVASTASQTAALPGNAPGILAQIGDFFAKIWEFFFKKPVDSTTPSAPAQPAERLPQLN